jgi:multidrug efflux pump
MSISGALIFLTLGLATINIYTMVGLITLIGLISKHGILIVEFANDLQQQGKSKYEAVAEAAGIRLRPILMTTFSTVTGVIPLLIATGPGAVSRFDIGLVVSTGMLIGTMFTLFVLPSIYLLLGKDYHQGASFRESHA